MFVFSQILTKNISQIINWAAFLQNIKSNKIFSGNKGSQNNNEKKLHFCQPKYIFKKQKYISQIPVKLNLFSLKTKAYIQEVTGKFIIQLINIIQINMKLLNFIYIN